MLIASVGKYLPVREFLFHYVPLMNLFRFPALFRVFAIICFIIPAGYAFNQWLGNPEKVRRKIFYIACMVALIVAGFVIFALSRKDLHFIGFLKNDLFIASDKSTIVQHILFQGLIQLILLSVFLLFLKGIKKKEVVVSLILMLIPADLILATQLNGPYTSYTKRCRSKDVKVHSLSFPKGFPLPGNGPVIKNTDSGKLSFQILWLNMNIFYKQISYQGYNPLHLKGFEEMADNHEAFFKCMLKNPVVYLTGKVFPVDSLKTDEITGDNDSSRVYLYPEAYAVVQAVRISASPGDSARITAFRPDRIRVEYSTAEEELLVFLQNNYYGWKAEIDQREVPVITANMSFLSILAPAGRHTVIFRYHPAGVIVGFWISTMMLAIQLIILLTLYILHKGMTLTSPQRRGRL
jgi:uncharacterized membrane protein YfhO